jgi:polyphosphate kinase
MSTAPAMVSIGDDGVLNREVSQTLSDVWIDRDLGWIEFNDRVLAEALDERTPLLERAKFLAIFSTNLDEFFMKRISVLRKGSTPERVRLLTALRDKLLRSLQQQADCFRNMIVPELDQHGIHLRRWEELNAAQQAVILIPRFHRLSRLWCSTRSIPFRFSQIYPLHWRSCCMTRTRSLSATPA